MSQIISRIWKPVRRRGAERFLQLTVLSFAASVSLTRLILELTNYPQLGNATLHIAHVLYGGVLLYVASLLPLLFANRWAYTWGAILSGIGVGLFIDEVGKFITQNNDYFFPAAAPIIYVFFLLTVLIYIRTKKEPEMDTRGEMYTVLETIQDIIDHDIDPDEHDELKSRLDNIILKTKNQNYMRLAMELEDFVDSDALVPVEDDANLFDRIIAFWKKLENDHISETRFRVILIVAYVGLGLPSFMRFSGFIMVAFDPIQRMAFLENVAASFPVSSDNIVVWALLIVVLDGFAGAFLSMGSILMIIERRNWSTQLASFSILLSLVAINIVLFYVEQFDTILIALAQYATLQAVYYYQRKYVHKPRLQ